MRAHVSCVKYRTNDTGDFQPEPQCLSFLTSILPLRGSLQKCRVCWITFISTSCGQKWAVWLVLMIGPKKSLFVKDLCSSCIGRDHFYRFEVRLRFVGSSKFLHNGATTYFAVSSLSQYIICYFTCFSVHETIFEVGCSLKHHCVSPFSVFAK